MEFPSFPPEKTILLIVLLRLLTIARVFVQGSILCWKFCLYVLLEYKDGIVRLHLGFSEILNVHPTFFVGNSVIKYTSKSCFRISCRLIKSAPGRCEKTILEPRMWLGPGWPDEFVKKSPKMWPNPFPAIIKSKNFYLGIKLPINVGYLILSFSRKCPN
jgi:hypothetical protein